MSTPSESADTRPLPPERSNSVLFPYESGEKRLKESNSSSSNLTSSDKLSALPTQSSPVLERLRSPVRAVRWNAEASGSLTSIDSPSGSLRALHSLPGTIQQSESESSVNRDTPRQRNESERSLPATLQNIRHSITGKPSQQNDSAVGSPSLRSRESSARGQIHSQTPPLSRHGQSNRPPSNNLSPPMQDAFQTPPLRSPAQSRAASPLRILHGWNLHRNHTRDEPFIPIDPFRSHIRWFGLRREGSPIRPTAEAAEEEAFEARVNARTNWLRTRFYALCHIRPRKRGDEEDHSPPRRKRHQWRILMAEATFFCSYTLPRQLYLWFLLHLPALYWQRVARVFEDAELSKPEIQRLIDACGDFAHDPSIDTAIATGFTTPTHHNTVSPGMPFPEEWTPPMVSPALARFKVSWEGFVDTLMREWKTFNLVSALLTATILTIFQIQDAANDPITRWSSLFSLVFAIMSLSYGCVYIVYFGSMRSMDRASRWAEEARKTRTALLWNIWVLLATPAIWLAWSMISFCVAILSFVWRTGSEADSTEFQPLTRQQALAVRIAISVLFAFGLFNFLMIIRTFSAYSHISVRRDRRSGFRRGYGRRNNGKEEEKERERGRGRGRDGWRGKKYKPGNGNGATSSDDEKEGGTEKSGKLASDSMVGLGLTGLGGDSTPGVILENVDPEKGDTVYLTAGALGKTSPNSRVSPKL